MTSLPDGRQGTIQRWEVSENATESRLAFGRQQMKSPAQLVSITRSSGGRLCFELLAICSSSVMNGALLQPNLVNTQIMPGLDLRMKLYSTKPCSVKRSKQLTRHSIRCQTVYSFYTATCECELKSRIASLVTELMLNKRHMRIEGPKCDTCKSSGFDGLITCTCMCN